MATGNLRGGFAETGRKRWRFDRLEATFWAVKSGKNAPFKKRREARVFFDLQHEMHYADARMKTTRNQTGTRRIGVSLILLLSVLAQSWAHAAPPQEAAHGPLPSILKYIGSSWDTLTRSQ